MTRWLVVACLLLGGCSDDTKPPGGGDAGQRDGLTGGDGRRREQGQPWDGIDPRCPMGPPCVFDAKGEGKHPGHVIIGELLTLTGAGLAGVDKVFLGAAPALIISRGEAQLTCRVGAGTPPGEASVEVRAGTTTRKFPSLGVTVRRLVISLAADSAKLQSFDGPTHAGGSEFDLAESPAASPAISAGGRYLVAPGASKLIVAALPLETSAGVDGLAGEKVTTFATDPEDKLLAIAAASGKLYSVDLGAFPALAAKPVALPSTVAVALARGAGAQGFAGLHATAAPGESSLWYAPLDLKSSSWVQQGGKPFTIGDGAQPIAIAGDDGALAVLASVGGAPQLALATLGGSGLSGEAGAAAAGARSVAIAGGGKHVALGGEPSSPALSYTAVGGALALKSVALGGSGAVRVEPVRLPTRQGMVAALVGPKPSSATFVAGSLELVDLAAGARLAAAGSKPALELADMRAAVGDGASDLVHVLTGIEYRSYELAVAGGIVTATEKGPAKTLAAGKDYRWIVAQP